MQQPLLYEIWDLGGFSLQQHLPEVKAYRFFLCRSWHTWAGW